MNGWKRKCVEDNNINEYLIKEFLFRASSAYLSINRMNMLSMNCVNEYRRQKPRLKLNNNRILFWTPTVIEILSEMSPFLSALRILQNNIFRLAAKECNPQAQVPKSLNEAIKKGLEAYGLNDMMCEHFLSYWIENGEELKNYRDMDQHYYAMIRRSYIQTYPEEKLLIFLPDSPEDKSTRSVTFEKELDAVTYLNEAFYKFHDFAEETGKLLGFEAENNNTIDVEGEFNVPEENGNSTLALVILDEETGRSYEAWLERQDEKTLLGGIHHRPISLCPPNTTFER